MGLGYPTCVRRGPILVKYIIISRIKSPTTWEKIVIQQLNVVFTINLGSISVNKIMFVFPYHDTPAETIIFFKNLEGMAGWLDLTFLFPINTIVLTV